MPIQFTGTDFEGLWIITPHVFTDNRGSYTKIYERTAFEEHGITYAFSECSDILSPKGVLRGLHFQSEDAQAKLVHVVQGAVYDVVVDLRCDSETFGKWEGFLLTAQKDEAVFIPAGFAHGFLSLEENTIFTYQCSGVYRPEFCGGIMWDDPILAIDWPLSKGQKVILSEKDKHNLSFKEYKDLHRG